MMEKQNAVAAANDAADPTDIAGEIIDLGNGVFYQMSVHPNWSKFANVAAVGKLKSSATRNSPARQPLPGDESKA